MVEQLENIFSQNKILDHIDKINNWLDGKLETIVTTEIDLTNRCNSNCPKCAGGRNNKSYLTTNQALDIIYQLVDIGVKGITLTGGGEPLLHEDINEIIEYITSKGIEVGVFTNGLKLDGKRAETILKYCKWCRISLDAGTKEMYKQMHGLGEKSFNLAVNNIRKIEELKKKIKSDCTIGTGFLTGKETVKGIEKFVLLSRSLGVDYCQLRPLHYDFTPIKKQLDKVKHLSDGKFKVLSSKHKYEKFGEIGRSYSKCYGCNFVSVITADYDVTTCCHTRGDSKYTFGNLSENTFKEIWTSEKRKNIIDSINVNKCIPFCCYDSLSTILWNIKEEKQHSNFL